MTRTVFCFLPLLLPATLTVAQDGYAALNGGTTGGKGGTTTTVSATAAFQTAIKSDTPKTVYLKGPITLSSQAQIGRTPTLWLVPHVPVYALIRTLGNNTSIIGVGTSGIINGGGLEINRKSNVIIRNLVINKVIGDDGITIQHGAHNIWIDHNEFYSDLNHGFDYYDGQVDITHASDYVTVSYNYFHDHYKSSLVGGDPNGGKEGELRYYSSHLALTRESDHSTDTGKYHLTYHHNHWKNVHTRTPAMRFGHVHVYNNFLENVISQGIHSRSYNQALIEGNVFSDSTEPGKCHLDRYAPTDELNILITAPSSVSTYGFVIPDDSPADPQGDYEPDGFANLGAANDFGGGKNNITATGNFSSVPYTYSLTSLANVKAEVVANAGVGKI
ncbi:hypothetical protein VNI00_007819 [Paramarasmius palmivorus]|uniref:Pectate lyase domain-containing protein n=1 Tax=Paramarasmius palmivorus TaxID=297713 RepID=A0AAW0CY37_9AGAR